MQSRKSSLYVCNHYVLTAICIFLTFLLLLQLQVLFSIESESALKDLLTPTQQRSPENRTDKNIDSRLKLQRASEINAIIELNNKNPKVLNANSFEVLQNDSVVIVVQVHNRIEYLRHLITSLGAATNISNTLLIFSHDFYDEDINDLVQTIDFCKVLQIFYPYSIQTHANEYPGVDPNDCPRDIKKEQAVLRKCNNALYPDLYGHYREAKFTQTKHHWWWKANRVFDQLEVTRYHTGLVLFLEEDHYVAEDFLYLLEMMQKRTTDLCPHCNLLSLGTYFKNADFLYKNYNGQVEFVQWYSGLHNMGFAVTRSTWEPIRNCKNDFCHFDDYNWDWSLQHVSEQCLKEKLHAMIIKGPRVFHIGECGVHHKNKTCDSTKILSDVRLLLDFAHKKGQLYPNLIEAAVPSRKKLFKSPKPNGGWGDIRDRVLCMKMTIQ